MDSGRFQPFVSLSAALARPDFAGGSTRGRTTSTRNRPYLEKAMEHLFMKLKKWKNSENASAAEAMAKSAKKKDLIIRGSGTIHIDGSSNFVRESMPIALLYNWQEALVQASLHSHLELNLAKTHLKFNLWEHSYIQACAMVDRELERHQEAERIAQCNGRVFCLQDEPGTHRIWLPNGETPGLSLSRSFGDFCVKHFGLISMPDVTQRSVTNQDLFVVLATDGIWDVVSNQEAVQIVHSTVDREKSARRLVDYATGAWKRRRPGIAADDMSVIVLFLHSSPLHH
ncbi:putative protein phosphatase 2C 48, partial [Cucurbita argyrosperma subsp. argyrosperma]